MSLLICNLCWNTATHDCDECGDMLCNLHVTRIDGLDYCNKCRCVQLGHDAQWRVCPDCAATAVASVQSEKEEQP